MHWLPSNAVRGHSPRQDCELDIWYKGDSQSMTCGKDPSQCTCYHEHETPPGYISTFRIFRSTAHTANINVNNTREPCGATPPPPPPPPPPSLSYYIGSVAPWTTYRYTGMHVSNYCSMLPIQKGGPDPQDPCIHPCNTSY